MKQNKIFTQNDTNVKYINYIADYIFMHTCTRFSIFIHLSYFWFFYCITNAFPSSFTKSCCNSHKNIKSLNVTDSYGFVGWGLTALLTQNKWYRTDSYNQIHSKPKIPPESMVNIHYYSFPLENVNINIQGAPKQWELSVNNTTHKPQTKIMCSKTKYFTRNVAKELHQISTFYMVKMRSRTTPYYYYCNKLHTKRKT